MSSMFAASHLLYAARTRSCALCNMTRLFASSYKGEERITDVLRAKFPQATYIHVVDISGGCGSMYEIHIESEEFKSKRPVQQHRMVNDALKEEIKDMHGLRIFTVVPK
ncbi:Hypothetical predicted protein [Pelobates cultripes]|uniref:BolA-like protein 3 n=1 Tax=Pelobates cultripes TaxID=61616 RepID=A0AAD1VYF7_PELCU|nr:Hypothetical predicted protein [Pelobates cultripes]